MFNRIIIAALDADAGGYGPEGRHNREAEESVCRMIEGGGDPFVVEPKTALAKKENALEKTLAEKEALIA